MTNVEDLSLAAERPSDVSSPVRRIVVGANGSEGSVRALEWTAELARSLCAEVTVVHVLTPNAELMRDFSFETMHLWRRQLEFELRGPWVEPLRRAGLTHRCLVVEADTVADGLVRSATRADLIVVSTRGRGRSATSHLLAQRTARPVVVVPSTWQPRPLST